MAKGKSGQNILVWILMGFLVIGLAGFGIDGFLTQRVTSIGSVGQREIDARDYSRALQSELNRFSQQIGQNVTLAQAQAFGLDRQVRAQLVTQTALEAEAERIGISLGDQNVTDTITAMDAFRGPGGVFDMANYRFQLENIGLTPAEFEESVRRDAARGILQAATAAGIETPDTLRTTLLDYFATRHAFDIFTLTEANLPTPVPAPTEAQVQAFYDANIGQFTTPETRQITYAWITPAMVLDQVETDEEALRRLYDSRLSQYVQPERRLVDRLVFIDTAAAEAALARITANEITFDDLVTERGLTLDDVDMGDVSQAQLGAAGAAVFALTEPGEVTGPHDSNLGPALFRMNAILNAQETTFDEVREELEAELSGDAARRLILDLQEPLDDLLAGGATLEELAAESQMELGSIAWSPESDQGIAAYSAFAAAAASISADDFPELVALDDGGLMALRLDGVTPPAPRPLADVRTEAEAGARAAQVDAALLALGTTLSADLAREGVMAFGDARFLAAETYADVTRLDRMAGIPPALLESVLDGEEGAPVILVENQTLYLGLIGAITPPDPADAQTADLIAAINDQVSQALAQDVFQYFARALEGEAGITLNQAAIDAVHTNFR